MPGIRFGLLIVLVGLMALALPACEEERRTVLGPEDYGDRDADGIVGLVLDDDEKPLAGVAIGLVYMLEDFELPGDWDAEKPLTTIRFELGDLDPVSIVILDNARAHVRTLVDETTEEIPDVIRWDFTDGEGNQVPVGLYIMRALFDDHTLIERVLFHYDYEIPAFVHKPNAVSDAEGRFRVPRNLIPVGAEIPIYSEDGDFLDLHKVLPEIMVIAVVEHEGVLHHLAEEVYLAEDEDRVEVGFVFPFEQD